MDHAHNLSDIEKEYQVAIVSPYPLRKPKQLERFAMSRKAIILVTPASGVVPQSLNETIKKLVDMDICVFLVSGACGTKHGILDDKHYQNQKLATDAGAIAIQTVGVQDIDHIQDTIQSYIDQGLSSHTLGNKVRDTFSYASEGEQPVCEREESYITSGRHDILEGFKINNLPHNP